jgi:MYXO-CTERM domain-containing protein
MQLPLRVASAVALVSAMVLAPAVARAVDPPLPVPEFPTVCPGSAVGCDTQDVDFSYRASLFDTVDLDSGWVPASSPVQLRFAFRMAGFTQVDMGGTLVTSWPFPLSGQLAGRPATGSLTIDYGVELVARMKIDLVVAGIHYRWEGDIPGLGSITGDYRMASTVPFDPFVLPGTASRPIPIADATDRVTVISYDALGGLIGSIPGISGGVAIDLQAALDASYQSERIVVAGADPILEELGTTRILPDEGASDFGGAKDVVLHPEGTLDYNGTLHVFPNIYISLLGRSWNFDIADVAIPLVDTSANAVFPDETVHVPLPAIAMLPTNWDLGEVTIGSTSEQYLDIANDGEAPLVVRARLIAPPFDVSTTPVVVPPHAVTRLAVYFSPETEATAAGTLFLETNDPDDALVLVMLRGHGLAVPEVDAGVGDAGVMPRGHADSGGCGCRVAAAPGGNAGLTAFALLALGALARVRRRRAA